MNTCPTNSLPVFCTTTINPSPKYFDNWFNGNKTNFGGKAIQPTSNTNSINTMNSNVHNLIRPM
jgi:hypothetical protein